VTILTDKILAIERSIQEETDKSLVKKGDAKAEVSVILASEEPRTVILKLTYGTCHPLAPFHRLRTPP
jgi:hypothetical protein